MTLSLDDESIKRVDEERGAITRNQFIANLVYWALVATDEQISAIEKTIA